MRWRHRVALGVVTATCAGGAHAVTPIYGAVSIAAYATVPGLGTRTDAETTPLNGQLGDRIEVDVAPGIGNGATAAYTFGRTYSYWLAPSLGGNNFGMIEFTRELTLLHPDTLTAPQVSAGFDGFSGAPDWIYTFKAGKSGTFVMNYDVFGLGHLAGTDGWAIGWDGPGGGLDLRNPVDPTTRGVFSRPFVKGQTYTVTLRGDGAAMLSALGTQDSTLIGEFQWDVAENYIPEPATWAMMVAGLAVVGVAGRRRRAGLTGGVDRAHLAHA